MIKRISQIFLRCWWLYIGVAFILMKAIDVNEAKTNRVNFLMQGEADLKQFLNGTASLDTSAVKLAMQYYLTWLKYAPRDGIIHANLAFCYYELNDYPKAIALLKTAIELEPYLNTLNWDLAWVYFKNDQLKEAISEWENFLKKLPRTSKYFQQLRLHFVERKEELAVSIIDKLQLQLNEDRTEAYIRLAECYYQGKQFAWVSQIAKEGLLSYPNNRWLHYMLGLSEYELGHWVEASNAFKEAIRVYPVDINAFYYHALCMRQLKLRDEEEKDLRRIRELKERGLEPLVMPKADIHPHFNTELLMIRYRLKLHGK